MAYARSSYRKGFDEQISFLIGKARRAQRLRRLDSDLRDLVFQCAVFRAGAATETYIKLVWKPGSKVEPKTSVEAAALPPPQIAGAGKAFTAQVMCVRVGGAD